MGKIGLLGRVIWGNVENYAKMENIGFEGLPRVVNMLLDSPVNIEEYETVVDKDGHMHVKPDALLTRSVESLEETLADTEAYVLRDAK